MKKPFATALFALVLRFALFVGAMMLATSASATILLSTSWSKNFPFGPFSPNERIEVVVSMTNTSATDALTICEGPCIGGELTYSLGGLTSLPYEYDFYFGDKSAPDDVFDGQIAGTLLPGQTKDFIYGVFTPIGFAAEGWYSFVNRVQIFDATAERNLLTTSVFSGQWEVTCTEFPGGGATGGCSPALPEPGTLALLSLGLAGLALTRRRKQ